MGVNSLPSAWRTDLRSGFNQSRDLRFYLDPRGVEYPDLETGTAVYTLAREDNLIDRGNCESATAPMLLGETVPVLTNTTFARSSDFAHGGTYAFKVIKTIAAGTGALVSLDDKYTTSTTDMHGLVAGETYEYSFWVYVPAASGISVSEIDLICQNYKASTAAWSTIEDSSAPTALDTWQKISGEFTVDADATGFVIYLRMLSTAALNEYFYVDDIRLTSHIVPGSHYLSSGYIETLCPMTQKFTLQIGFISRFAFNIGAIQYLWSWRVSATQYFRVLYDNTADKFYVQWIDGGTQRTLASAQYDNGASYRNIGQKIVLTTAIDLSTGTTAGSALWMDKTQDDTAWSGNIDAKVTEFNKAQIRAYNGTAYPFDILYARLFPNLVATNAQVQNDFKDVANEEIFWSLDGHGTGRTRCNISPFLVAYDVYKGVTSKVSASHGTNLLNFMLKNLQGEFSDDQYASFSPTSYQYNGTAAQSYLTRRTGVMLESWYSGDFEHVYVGRLTEAGLQRASYNHATGYVSGSAEDGVGDIDRTVETNGRAYDAYDICDPATESDSLFHTIAHLADRYNKQYLANNSFENATIGDSWLVTAGGTLNKDAADGYFGTCSGELIPGAAAEQAYQTVTFTAKDKLNVGDIFTFWCYVKSTAAATGANNYIEIAEADSGGEHDDTTATYTLAGGEGYKLAYVTHTITEATSDRLVVYVSGAAGDTINIDACMLVRTNTPLPYFAVNSNNGASGVESADDAADISWPWFGIDANAVDIEHPWRRVEAGTTIWENLKSLANASGPKYLGMSECNTLVLKAILQTDYSDDVPIDELTGARQNINVSLDEVFANKIIGHGNKIVKGNEIRLIWCASSTGNFADSDGDNVLEEVVANGATWPSTTTYPEYWAQFGACGDLYMRSNMTLWPNTGVSLLNHYWTNPAFANMTPGQFASAIGVPAPVVEYYLNQYKTAYLTIPTSKRDRIIGLQDADLIHKLSDTGDGQGGFTETTFDVNAKAGKARILLTNGLGSQKTLVECAIIGKPVYLYDGEDGYINDGHIDRADIMLNGERLLEFGGSDVIDGSAGGQLDKLCDYLWKDRGKRKHIYTMTFSGSCHDFSPADVYLLSFGAAGETEYIDSRAEVVSVRIEHRAATLGVTYVTFRELEEAWKYDSNVYSRFVARGVLVQSPSTGAVVTVGSEYCTVATDYRVTIGDTSAEDVINAAINFVNGAFGGGTVHLTRGTFKTDGAIVLKAGVILEGEGNATIIERNCNDYAIASDGAVGSEIVNAGIRHLQVTRNAADTNAASVIFVDRSNNFTLLNVLVTDAYAGAFDLQYCNGMIARGLQVKGFGTTNTAFGVRTKGGSGILSDIDIDGESTARTVKLYGLTLTGVTQYDINNVIVRNLNTNTILYGVYIGDEDAELSNVAVRNCDRTTAGACFGICIGANRVHITNAHVEDIDNTNTAADSRGIYIDTDIDNCVISGILVSGCSGTGVLVNAATCDRNILVGRSTGNGTNATDNGTNTNKAAFDST